MVAGFATDLAAVPDVILLRKVLAKDRLISKGRQVNMTRKFSKRSTSESHAPAVFDLELSRNCAVSDRTILAVAKQRHVIAWDASPRT